MSVFVRALPHGFLDLCSLIYIGLEYTIVLIHTNFMYIGTTLAVLDDSTKVYY